MYNYNVYFWKVKLLIRDQILLHNKMVVGY